MGDKGLEAEIERLRKEVAAGSEFVNLAAHQLQEPLASMKWQLESLLAERGGVLKPKQRSMVDEAYAINQDAIRLVKDLLAVARLEGGRLQANKKKTDIVKLVRKAMKRFEPAIKEYRGKVHFDSPREKIPQILADHRLLTQAIDNLISNAIKYNPLEMHLDLAVKLEPKWVVISIRNKGSLIPPEKQKEMFQKFSRAKSKGTGKTSGTGLGLYITKQIVELHQGEISFSSVKKEGTTFLIKLPL